MSFSCLVWCDHLIVLKSFMNEQAKGFCVYDPITAWALSHRHGVRDEVEFVQHKHTHGAKRKCSRLFYSQKQAGEVKHIMKTLECAVGYQPIHISPLLLLKKQHTVHSSYHIFPIDENCFHARITFGIRFASFSLFPVSSSWSTSSINLLFLFSRFPPVFYLCWIFDSFSTSFSLFGEKFSLARISKGEENLKNVFIAFIIILIALLVETNKAKVHGRKKLYFHEFLPSNSAADCFHQNFLFVGLVESKNVSQSLGGCKLWENFSPAVAHWQRIMIWKRWMIAKD